MSGEDDQTSRETCNLPILAYHKVTDMPYPCDSAWITQEVFSQQMAALHAYGYTTVSFIDIVNFKKKCIALPSRPIILTFDDGYECVYRLIRPILNKFGFKATCFLCPDYIGIEDRYDNSWDVGDSGWPTSMMLWKEAAIMEAEGHFCEAHSLSHPHLNTANPWKAYREIAGAKKEIEKRLNKAVTCFAYPFGDGVDSSFLRFLVSHSGYKAAVSYNSGMADPATSDIMALPRIKITQEHSVDLNSDHPEVFFMHIIDPSFPLPCISIDHIEMYDSQSKDRRKFFVPGERMTIEVFAVNSGCAINVWASLQIIGNTAKGDLLIFNSHPRKDVFKKSFTSGLPQGFTYTFRIPDDAAEEEYRLNFSIHDEKYVLRYFHGTEACALLRIRHSQRVIS
ncbi:MAG: polysaccharide deacetylase family protein [Methanothrix sp.]|nr:polysaccharide deacetylase family protein [Methanothrix sp.]MDD4447763.1 polysaccharide deacetylase family protein [Methanothrix sp.]